MTFFLNRSGRASIALTSVAAVMLLAASLLTSRSALAQEHIAVVNSVRILQESVPAKQAETRLKNEFEPRRAEIEKATTDLRVAAQNFDKNAASMNDAARSAAQSDLSRRDLDLQRKRRQLDEDFNERKNAYLAAVLDQANKVIAELAVKGNYDLIVQEAVYVSPRIDITDKVLAALKAHASASTK